MNGARGKYKKVTRRVRTNYCSRKLVTSRTTGHDVRLNITEHSKRIIALCKLWNIIPIYTHTSTWSDVITGEM